MRYLICTLLFTIPLMTAIAQDDPIKQRQQLMKEVRQAAKPLGGMMRGSAEIDADTIAESLAVFERAAATYGDMFPKGSETGGGTEAAPAIWSDREGFEEILDKWAAATAAAQGMTVTTQDEARAALGPVFQNCKGCHDNYRIEDE